MGMVVGLHPAALLEADDVQAGFRQHRGGERAQNQDRLKWLTSWILPSSSSAMGSGRDEVFNSV